MSEFRTIVDTVTDPTKQEEMQGMRKRCSDIVQGPAFEVSMAVLVVMSVVSVVIETNAWAAGRVMPGWLQMCDVVAMSMYVVEAFMRIYVFRLQVFKDKLIVFDLLVIVADVLCTVILHFSASEVPLPAVTFRVARLLRMTRAVRMMTLFQELNMMITGLAYALKAILWGGVMLAVVIVFWSIVAVILIHPINVQLTAQGVWDAHGCGRCPRAFESVQQSMLTFTQGIVAGDSWGTISVPIIEARPETAIFFLTVLISISLAVMNLILAVIVERATASHETSMRQEAERKDQEFTVASMRLLEVCKELDIDGNGCISFPELVGGFRNHDEFGDIMKAMDIQELDLEVVFNMLDPDDTGDIRYEDFVRELYMMKYRDMNTLLAFIKFYIMDIHEQFLHPGFQSGRRGAVAAGFDRRSTRVSKFGSRQVSAAEDVPRADTKEPLPVSCGIPDLDAELSCLQEIREEVLQFASSQVARLDTVQHSFVAAFQRDREPWPAGRAVSEEGAPIASEPLAAGVERHRFRDAVDESRSGGVVGVELHHSKARIDENRACQGAAIPKKVIASV